MAKSNLQDFQVGQAIQVLIALLSKGNEVRLILTLIYPIPIKSIDFMYYYLFR